MDVFGVDFSGAADAGAKVWVAEAEAVGATGTGTGGVGNDDGPRLRVRRCASMAARTGTAEREPCLAALVDLLPDAGVVGLDASFGLPRAVCEYDDWRAFLEAFPDAPDASAFQARYRERARAREGDGVDLKRATDAETGASSPYGLITYKQTYHALRDVIGPLARGSDAVFPPMDDPDGTPVICEAYPAATLRDLGLPDERYKDDARHPGAPGRREEILAGLRERGVEAPDRGVEGHIYV